LAKTLEVVLDVVKEALGTAVEIEFALDLDRDKPGPLFVLPAANKTLIGSALTMWWIWIVFKEVDICFTQPRAWAMD
jgi:hypothetical protein